MLPAWWVGPVTSWVKLRLKANSTIEIETYAALKRGEPKEAVISQIVADENVVFLWELVVFIEQQSSHELLQEVVEW